MKWLLPAVLIGAALFFALFLRPGGGWTRVAPAGQSSGWDGVRCAFRQIAVTVSDADGNSVSQGLTLFGDGRQVLEPWLDTDFALDGRSLTRPGGERHSLDAGHHIGWQTPGGDWVFVPGPFPDLGPFSREWRPDLDSRLFDALRDRFPDQGELLRKIESDVGTRTAPR